jgi:hypothetical protein
MSASAESLDYLDQLLLTQSDDIDDGQRSFNELLAEMIQADTLNITERQQWLMQLDPRIKLIAEIGAKGTGKSFTLMLMALSHCEAYGDDARCLVVRRYRDDTEPMQRLMIEILRLTYFGGDGGKAEKCLNRSTGFVHPPCGGIIRFIGIESLKDCAKIRGGNWNFLGVDEATEHASMEILATLRQELRSPRGHTRIVYTGNPTRSGVMAEIKQMYCSQTPFMPFLEEGTELPCIFAPARPDDNPFLIGKKRKEHDAQIAAVARHDPDLAEALQTGDLSKLGEGDMFGQVWSPHRNIIGPFVDLPDSADAEVFIAIDHGGASSSTVALFCLLCHERLHLFTGEPMPRGSLIIYDEYDDAMPDNLSRTLGLGIAENCGEIIKIADHWQMYHRAIIDRQVIQDHGAPNRLADEYNANGLKVTDQPAIPREAKATLTRELMRGAATHGYRQRPGLYITRNCRNTLATIPKLLRDPARPDAVKKCGTDHWYDALGFAINHKREKFQITELYR